MSKRTLIGIDGTGTACVKIMADAAFDPVTTPDSDYSKFDFNSKDAGQFRYGGADIGAYNSGLGTNAAAYLPSGAGASNYTKVNVGASGYNFIIWTNGFFPQLDYNLPVHDMKMVRDGWVQGAVVGSATYGLGGRCGQYSLYQAWEGGWLQGYTNTGSGPLATSKSYAVGTKAASSTWPVDYGNRQLIVWNLPGDETALKDPPLTPVPGQMTVQISKDYCRVAKPGYDVRTATRTQLAFDSSNRPLKVIYANDIAVPSGSMSLDMTPYLSGIAVSGELVVDISSYQGSALYYPISPITSNVDFGVRYAVSANTILLNNPYAACRARIIVFAIDASVASAGSNRVLKQFNDGTQDVVQFLRPGAADPPNLADVIVDSRWPTLRVIKEGTISLSSGNGVQYVVPFDSTGFFPIVKYMTIHGGGSNAQFSGSFSKRVRFPYLSRIYASGVGAPGAVNSGGSTFCQLTSAQAIFTSYVGNPRQYDCNEIIGSPGYSFSTVAENNPPYAIRYYILGIPAT
jgi:hypothetical protein